MARTRNARLAHQDWRNEPITLCAEPTEVCTRCGATEVEWLNQFCQECWESYTAQEWNTMIQNASPQIYSGTIGKNSAIEDES